MLLSIAHCIPEIASDSEPDGPCIILTEYKPTEGETPTKPSPLKVEAITPATAVPCPLVS